jgi:uncharacterized membrane protein
MTEIISHVFDERRQAEDAVRALERDGFSTSEISLLTHGDTVTGTYDDDDAGAATSGATLGGVTGAGIGLLAALGTIAIPGIGPLVAAGLLATTVAGAGTGAVVGGLAGALIDYGVSSDDAEVYSEAVRRGGTLLTVHTTPAKSARARLILSEHGTVDIDHRRGDYMKSGWTGYDPKAPVYSPEQAERERARWSS